MKNIRHTGIYVKDLEKMKKFYCTTFQMNVVVHAIEESDYIDTVLGVTGSKIELYKLQCDDGSMIELLRYVQDNSERSEKKKIYQMGCSHIAFTIIQLDELYVKLRATGIMFISEPVISPDGKAKVCFCMDPEGNYLELVEEL